MKKTEISHIKMANTVRKDNCQKQKLTHQKFFYKVALSLRLKYIVISSVHCLPNCTKVILTVSSTYIFYCSNLCITRGWGVEFNHPRLILLVINIIASDVTFL